MFIYIYLVTYLALVLLLSGSQFFHPELFMPWPTSSSPGPPAVNYYHHHIISSMTQPSQCDDRSLLILLHAHVNMIVRHGTFKNELGIIFDTKLNMSGPTIP